MGTCEELMALAQEQVGKTSGEEYWEWYRETYAPWLPHYVNGALTPYCAIWSPLNVHHPNAISDKSPVPTTNPLNLFAKSSRICVRSRACAFS